MFTNSEIIQQILKEHGLSVYDVHKKLNNAGYVYENFKNNVFSAKFIKKLEEITGEDLQMFINYK